MRNMYRLDKVKGLDLADLKKSIDDYMELYDKEMTSDNGIDIDKRKRMEEDGFKLVTSSKKIRKNPKTKK